jgi:hypothetical protein
MGGMGTTIGKAEASYVVVDETAMSTGNVFVEMGLEFLHW